MKATGTGAHWLKGDASWVDVTRTERITLY